LPDRETHLDVFLTSGRDPDIAVRLASVEALQKVPSERAKAMLKVLANDDASAVRVAAAQALSPR
jgi:HEAT repeat protein